MLKQVNEKYSLTLTQESVIQEFSKIGWDDTFEVILSIPMENESAEDDRPLATDVKAPAWANEPENEKDDKLDTPKAKEENETKIDEK